MNYNKITAADVSALGEYLGIDRAKWSGGPVRKRECPNCATTVHGGQTALATGDIVAITSETCREIYWRCPGCTHGTDCSEYREGMFHEKFIARDGRIRRFLTVQDLAARLGVSPATVHRWITRGKLSETTGLIRAPYRDFIDAEKCPLLTRRWRAARKVAA